MSGELPLPSPGGALLMTLLATVATLSGWLLLAPVAGHSLGLALGLCVGFGGVATVAARSMPGEAQSRLGLHGFAPRMLLPIALLLPSVALASELDNLVRPLFPVLPLPPGAAPPSAEVVRLATLELAIAGALLRPVLEEFFFRGVIQQGVVGHLGPGAGVAYTAVLFALASGGLALPFGPDHAASEAVQAAFAGVLLGLLRQAAGSVLAPMVASCAFETLGLASVTFLAGALPIPGYNAPGPHTPPAVLAACAAAVAAGAWLAARWAAAPRDAGPDPGTPPRPAG